MQPLTLKFKTYLAAQDLSPATLKNYVSDADQFLDWLAGNLQEEVLEARQLTETAFNDYGRWLNAAENHIHPATAARHLSSLRALAEFLVNQNFSQTNPAIKLQNQAIDPTIDQILNEFKNELKRQKLSGSTVKNYFSDVKNYLLWAKKHLERTDNKINLLS